ncbi:Aste57867_24409 [Aphanomyces stellatus]|uniref:Aste57867_24409 protein n=1 Tax=Aphanomyces stellatus TaxID=120398 RepID=A0A485LQ97_9STRA|nr:hypothetical protein As57867_024333 [Aphanomyces stellatus]VFU01049.1 Aste57867_24409 [Aphanomyces stellatus]
MWSTLLLPALALFLAATPAVAAKTFVLVSGGTNPAAANPVGLSVFRLDNGHLTPHETYTNATTGNQPTYMALSYDKRFLYLTNEVDQGQVASFRVQSDGSLQPLGIAPTHSNGPVHLVVTQDNRFIILASYNVGSVTVMEIRPDGRVGAVVDQIAFAGGSGVVPGRQDSSHVHCVALSPCNCFVFVTDLGNDKIMQFQFSAKTGHLTPNTPAYVSTGPGTLPRHMAFHPSGDRLYLTTEFSNELVLFDFDHTRGTLSVRNRTKTTTARNVLTAAIHMTATGHVLVSNRGGRDNSVAVFHEDLRHVGSYPTSAGDGYPRDFTIFEAQVFAANQLTNDVVAFDVVGTDPTLRKAAVDVSAFAPQCVLGLSV